MNRQPGTPVAKDEESLTATAPLPNPPLGESDDDALILRFLSLSVAERVAVAQDFVDSAAALKHGLRS